jgi:hypothetical protein
MRKINRRKSMHQFKGTELRDLSVSETESVSGGYYRIVYGRDAAASIIESLQSQSGPDRFKTEFEARQFLAFRRANPELTHGQAYADFYNL